MSDFGFLARYLDTIRKDKKSMIDVYTWPTPNGHKVHIMLEECALDYTIYGVNIRAGEQFAEHFLEISPNNRIPAIVDHDGPGGAVFPIFESGAILIYLAENKRSGKVEKISSR